MLNVDPTMTYSLASAKQDALLSMANKTRAGRRGTRHLMSVDVTRRIVGNVLIRAGTWIGGQPATAALSSDPHLAS